MQPCTRGRAPRPGSSAATAAGRAGTGEPRGRPGAAGPGRSVAAADERPRAGRAWPPRRDYSSQQAVREAAPAAEAPGGPGPGAVAPWRAEDPRPRNTWSGCTRSSAGCTGTCGPSPSGCGAARPVRRGGGVDVSRGRAGPRSLRPGLPRRLRECSGAFVSQACSSSCGGSVPSRLCWETSLQGFVGGLCSCGHWGRRSGRRLQWLCRAVF